MKILFVAAQLYFPQLYGGVQTSTDQLCRALMQRGHQVSLLASLMPGGFFGWKSRLKMQINHKLRGGKAARDTGYGYAIWRTWHPAEALGYVAAEEKPDLIVVLSGKMMPLVEASKRTRLPILVQLHDVAFAYQEGDIGDLSGLPCVANSHFTAKKYRDAYGIASTVIYPFIAPANYRTQSTKENVTFINPHPRKGLDVALQIAKLCPDIPFAFIEGWTLSPEQRRDLMQKLSGVPNVALLPSQKNMRKIYGKCKILLAPSLAEETYGRVVTEAQASGIPAIASKRGGLPESVGPGGILLDPEGPIEAWIDAVRKLWNDPSYYGELSAAARRHAERPEMNFSCQIEAHEQALLAACRKAAR
jgi:glycosyltransferase involved in cell wall biosynthesis